MRKLIILFLLFSFSGIYSQQIVQTYTDRCTGATKVFTVQLGGSTVITFYDRSKVFTSAEFQNGALTNVVRTNLSILEELKSMFY